MTLRITTEATTSSATPLNLVSHAYWNLDGGGDILSHRLTMAADRIVAVDSHLIPTGALPDVAGTPCDFRKPRLIGDGGIHYDINYALDRQGPGLVQGAVLQGQRSGIRMEVWTTEPGIQLYDGKFLRRAVRRPWRALPRMPALSRCAEPAAVPQRHPAARRKVAAGDGAALLRRRDLSHPSVRHVAKTSDAHPPAVRSRLCPTEPPSSGCHAGLWTRRRTGPLFQFAHRYSNTNATVIGRLH